MRKALIVVFVVAAVVTLVCGLLNRAPKGLVKLDAGSIAAIDKLGANQNREEATVEFKLVIHNNPFEFDSTSRMTLLFNDRLVYRGNFQMRGRVNVPASLVSKNIRPQLWINHNDTWFDGRKKEPYCFKLLMDSVETYNNSINIIFMEEYTAPSNYLVFTGHVE